MIKKNRRHEDLRKYKLAKVGLGCLFAGTLLSAGILVYLLYADDITISRLVLLALLMVISYMDGAFSGMVCRKIEELEEDQTDEND